MLKNCFNNTNDIPCIAYLSINPGQLELKEDRLQTPYLCCNLRKYFLHKLLRCLVVKSEQGYYLYLFNSQCYDSMILKWTITTQNAF
jgi:hypothetical protein